MKGINSSSAICSANVAKAKQLICTWDKFCGTARVGSMQHAASIHAFLGIRERPLQIPCTINGAIAVEVCVSKYVCHWPQLLYALCQQLTANSLGQVRLVQHPLLWQQSLQQHSLAGWHTRQYSDKISDCCCIQQQAAAFRQGHVLTCS